MVGARVPRARRRCEMKSGWVTKKLGEVCEINYGTRVRRKDSRSDNYPVYGGGGETFRWEIFNRENQCVVSRFAMSPECVRFVSGKFFLNDSGLTVDAASDGLLQDYLDWCLFGKQDIIYALGKGSAQKNLDIREFVNIPIPIPPLAEQKRIVAKIDAAFEKIDKLKADAEKNLANAKELFQSALDEAMRPKKGWVEKRLGEVGPVCMCKRILKSETNESGGVPFYKIGTFGKTPNAYISEETYRRYRELYKFPRKGEILISAAGTIGRTVVYDGEPAYFQDSNIVWIANDETKVSNAYLQWYYKTSPWCVTKGATIPRLYNDNITSAAIAIPPIAEQRQIVKRLDFLAEKVKLLEQHYTRQIADCAEMRQAVLREAFEGRL